MKKFIHLRGGMAVGKTSTARQFISRGSFVNEQINVFGKYYPYMYDKQCGIVVTGRYDDRVCGGLDGRITNKQVMLEYIAKIAKEIGPKYIVFEAVMYGKTVKFAEDVSALIGRYGYEYVGICLLPPLECASERLAQRNGGKTINWERFSAQHLQSERSYLELKKRGYNMRAVDTSRIEKGSMWEIIQKEIE